MNNQTVWIEARFIDRNFEQEYSAVIFYTLWLIDPRPLKDWNFWTLVWTDLTVSGDKFERTIHHYVEHVWKYVDHTQILQGPHTCDKVSERYQPGRIPAQSIKQTSLL